MNETADNKITFLQALLIYIVTLYPPEMRYLAKMTAAAARQASWLSVVCSMIAFVPLLLLVYRIARKFEGKSLYDMLRAVFGKAVGTVVSFLIMIWLFILLVLYLKYSAVNLITTEFIGTDANILMFLAVVLAGTVLRFGLPVLSRINKFVFIFIVIQFVIVLFFLFLHFRPDYITPVSVLDVGPVLYSGVYPLTLFVYIVPVLIFNEQILYGKKNTGRLIFTAGYITVKNTLMMLALLGIFSYPLVAKLNLPFFSAVENISVFKSSAGLDSLFVAIWLLAEFVLISFFAYCVSRLIKNIFGLNSQTPALTAILGLALIFAVYFSTSIMELFSFSKEIAPYMNLSMGIGIPAALFIVGKIRKMI